VPGSRPSASTPEVLYIDQEQLLTSAGLSAGIDMCLYMVGRDYGASAAGTPPG
jgi:transcriptional regulator GlxA family with amidase domain